MAQAQRNLLPAGQVLTVTADAVSTGTVRRLAQPGERSTNYAAIVVAASSTVKVGPFTVARNYEIISTTGEVSIAIAEDELNADAVHQRPLITGLTGGGAAKLDGISTINGAIPTGYTLTLSYGRTGQTWQLIDGTDAEDVALGVVRPDDYSASANARIWVQI